MGIFSRFEQRLAGSVNGAFAKAFRAEVQPVELASAVRAAMDERAAHLGRKQRPVVPNLFSIELSGTDYDRLTSHEQPLVAELRASAQEHAETQRYTPGGPFDLQFRRNDELETGVFRLRPSVASAEELDSARPAPQFGQYAAGFPEYSDQSPGTDDEDPDYEPADHEPFDDEGDEQDDFEDDDADYEAAPEGSLPERPHPAYQLPGFGRRAGAPAPPAGTAASAPPVPATPAPSTRFDPHQPSAAAPRAVRRRPWLDLDGEKYPLIGAITVIGRDDDADIVLDDPGVSRRHSELRVTTDGPHLIITLTDLDSTNGTFVNGDPVGRHHLLDGDRITVGRTSLVFHAGGRR